MKRLAVLASLVMTLGLASASHAKGGAGTGLYLGLGGCYAAENFDMDEIDDITNEFGAQNINLNNTWGINGKVGYHLQNWFALEFSVDYFSDFEGDRNNPVKVDVDVELATYMAVAKLVDEFYGVRPFACAGLGYMDVEGDIDIKSEDFSGTKSRSFNGACGKVGLGMDVLLNRHVSLGTEVSYVWGFGDVEDFRYLNFMVLNIAYHF